ncbi:hypothetical protein Tco_1253319 [Tanacetum coccineum]
MTASGRVEPVPETCQVKSHILDSSPDKPDIIEYSKQFIESENNLLKKTVAQFQKDFSRMEAHCIAFKLKYQNQALKSGQHGQILNETSNKAKIEKEIDVLETMNIELEHSVATLRKLFDSCTSKVDSEPPHGSNVDIPHIYACKQTLDSMVAEKADISETIVKVDSQMMIQKYGVRSHLPHLNIHSTHQTPTQVSTVTAPENITQAETNTENAQFDDDEFINIFSTSVQEQGETSSRHVDSSNMHTFYQHHPSAQRWTKDHPLKQVIRNPSQSVRTRRQLE